MNFRILALAVCLCATAFGQVPQLLHHQGRVAVDGLPFAGTGQFKFALVNGGSPSQTYWSNDGTSVAGSEPSGAMPLVVAKGLYSVLLGDAALTGMTQPVASAIFAHDAVYLRVWFNDGVHGSQLLEPDQRIAAVGYALTADTASSVADGAVTSAKISPNAVGPSQLAAKAVTAAALADGAVGSAQLAPGSVQSGHLAAGAVGSAQLAQNLTVVGTITAANFVGSGAGLANLPGGGGGFKWQTVSGTTQQAQPNTGYLATDNSLVTVTLPAAPTVGDVVRVSGVGIGGWKIGQNAGQSVLIGGLSVAAGNWTPHESSRVWYAIASSADGAKLVAVERTGKIYTSTDFGATFTPHENGRDWVAVASSADGTKLVVVVFNGPIFTSTDSGSTWTSHESFRFWYSVASSADGTKLVALANGGQIYTSTDSGVSWTPRESARAWYCSASSSDGSKLVAGVNNGQIYTSTDSGATWVPRDSVRRWFSVTSSSDGTHLAAVTANGQIYVSADAGATWAPRELNRSWVGITSAADGTKLAAVVTDGQIYTSADAGSTWKPRDIDRHWTGITSSADGTRLAATVSQGQIFTTVNTSTTTVGTAGSLSGGQGSAIELQFIGGGRWQPLSSIAGPFGYN